MHFPTIIKDGSDMETNLLMEALQRPYQALGSVFDASSVGNWIHDWTVYPHGPTTALADRQWNSEEK
jgi:hypothetical protein